MLRICSAVLLLATFSSAASASERGSAVYPHGADTQRVAVLPPPGQYALTYSMFYTSNRLNDDDGRKLPVDFALDATAQIGRVINVSKRKILGATWAQQFLVPIVGLRARVGGTRSSRSGIGDIIVNPFILGWTSGNAHLVAGMDTFIPTGRFSARRLANIGSNHWTFQPIVAVSYIPRGDGPEGTVKLMYDINTRNKATDYRTGETAHADVSAGYNIGHLMVGVTGYYSKQVTDDRQYGASVGTNGNREEVLGLGPAVRYVIGAVPITGEWQHEFTADNRPQGDKFWIKAAFRL